MGVIDSKKAYKDVGDAVGMPDEQDKLHIQAIILRYEKNHPGEIKQLINYARKYSQAFDNEYGLVSGKGKASISSNNVRYLLELPPQLHEQLEAYIPTLFRSKRHFHWFCKNFKNLVIPEKI